MRVNTVLGEIEPEKLGSTLVHEHMFVDGTIWAVKPDQPRYRKIFRKPVALENVGLVRRAGLYSIDNLVVDDFEMILDELSLFKQSGGSTVIDLTVDGIGRDVERLHRLSRKSRVNIIAPTGYYVDQTIPPWVKKSKTADITSRIVRDIEEGIDGSGVKAGVIGEIGVSPGRFTENERKVLIASAKAQTETGVPLTVHMWGDPPGKWPGFEVIDLLEARGADVSKVYISHIDWTFNQTNDWSIAKRVAKLGLYLSFDNFGNEWPASTQYSGPASVKVFGAPTDYQRIEGIKELVEAGFENQILLAHDLSQKIHFKKYGGHGLDHIPTNVPNLFRMLNVKQSLLSKFLKENPKRLFS
ncbi:MAG TPA: hypothetical protein VFF30_18470 [Nitrososphaerales archaeon]|nr:hypothetical protein [Nitrososphaerales archaeon]